ncbi:SAM-dependent methyltransferase [Actinopolyspora mortivallis]|uniref:SAM-dependent methyltransferase n=1 Tax=Actinopolyspora mortivallis TaxID=33906 RepID=UPI0003668246|nr:SAM-dependent methyltransferase [Actinopolyspora mortivallis]
MTTHSDWDIATGVGFTALVVAAGRAVESGRPHRLIDDPYAAELVRAAGTGTPLATDPCEADPVMAHLADHMAVRSRCLDDWFDRACSAGVRQAVVLASGLDTRAFRLSWPEGFRLFEIDRPRVLEFKDSVLSGRQPGCDRRTVGVDLREEWSGELERAGFDRTAPTAWLAEGLLPYLPARAERRLLETVHSLSAPGSRVAVEQLRRIDLMSDVVPKLPATEWGVDLTALFAPEDKPDPAGLLGELGWRTGRRDLPRIAASYDRRLPSEETLAPLTENTAILCAELSG